MLKTADLHLEKRHFRIIIFPIIILLIFLIGMNFLREPLINIFSIQKNLFDQKYSSAYIGLYFLFATFFALIFCSSTILIIFFKEVMNIYDTMSNTIYIMIILLFVLSSIIFCVLYNTFDVFGNLNIYKLSLKILSGEDAQLICQEETNYSICNNVFFQLSDIYIVLILFSNIFIAFAFASIILGTISCLAFVTEYSGFYHESIHFWQLSRLRNYLYMSSFLFLCWMFFIISRIYGTEYIIDFSDRESYRAVANAFVLYFGVSVALMLLSYYMPVAFMMSDRAEKLIEWRVIYNKSIKVSQDTVQQWRNELGASVSLANLSKSILAALSPLLTGLAGAIASALLGGAAN